MAFTKDFDNVGRLDRHYRRMDRELDQWDLIIRPYQRMLEDLESPLVRTAQEVSAAATAALGGQPSVIRTVADVAKRTSGLQQMMADHVASLDLAKTWGVRNVAAEVARSFNSRYQDLAAGFAAQQLHPLQSFAASMAATGLPQEVARDSWRPVLMHGFQAATLVGRPEIATAAEVLNGSLTEAAQLHATSVVGVLREVQAQQAQAIGSQVARAMRDAASTSLAWEQVRTALKDYQLRAVRVAQLSHDGAAQAYRPPATHLPRPQTSPPAAAPPASEQHAVAPPASEACPQELPGRWTTLQPVENVLYGIVHGPLVVRIIAIGLGHIVIAVIAGGVVYFLFYCC